MELEEADGDLFGPIYEGGRVVAEDSFASIATSCTAPCSFASVSENSTYGWSIDEMMLFADGWFEVDNGTLSETVDFGYIELYGSAPGTWRIDGGIQYYEVAVGDAAFIAGGNTDGDAAHFLVYNSTPINATQLAGEWQFDSFEIEYAISGFGTLTLTVSASSWIED